MVNCKYFILINFSKNNRMNGNGYMVWCETNEKYVGQWTDNLQNGLGIHIWYESKGEQKYLRNRYVGEWKNGFRHGYGIFFYSNGSKYEGTWDQNFKHGYGIFTFYDGGQYIGRFHSDRMIDFNIQGIYAPTTVAKIPENSSKSTLNSHKYNQRRSKISDEDINSNLNKVDKFNLTSNSNNNIEKDFKERANKIVSNLDPIPEGNEGVIATNVKEITSNQIKNFNNNNLTMNNNTNLNNQSNININPNLSNNSILQDNINSNRTGNVITSRAYNIKESESNQFKTSMDITDIIECEPEVEKSLRDVENTLLRHLSEIKRWYIYYTNKDKDLLKETESPYENTLKTSNTLNIMMIEKYKQFDDKKNYNTNILPNQEKNSYLDTIYSNDLGFCMELKDLWKFIRECKVLSSDFTLAQFNRIFFRGPKNYIEMFMCPDDIDQKRLYEYIFLMIGKAKKDFCTKYRQHIDRKKMGESGDLHNLQNNIHNLPNLMINDKQINSSISNMNYMPTDLELNFDIHNKRQVILLRQFYEAIVRIAYLKFFDHNLPLNTKLNMLIDNYIKFNPHFKKVPRKQQNMTSHFGDSSLNSSVLDMKVRTLESNLENFMVTYESKLKIIFKQLYHKSTPGSKKYDMTITYNFFYESIVSTNKIFSNSLDKYKFIELINIYHKDKIFITEENKSTKEIFTYIDNLMESEMIFYEFCEMVFYISRNYFIYYNLQETKNNYDEAIMIIFEILNKKEFVKASIEKFEYSFPKLNNHIAYEKILEMKRLKDEEEQKKRDEIKRVKMERDLMINEDLNVLPKEDDDEELESEEEEEYSSYY
jgi:hypothetical protein